MSKFDKLYEETVNKYSDQNNIDEAWRFKQPLINIYIEILKYIISKYNLQNKAKNQFNQSVESGREKLANLIQKTLKTNFEYDTEELIQKVNDNVKLIISFKGKELDKRINELENMNKNKLIDILNNVNVGSDKVSLGSRAKLKNINVSVK